MRRWRISWWVPPWRLPCRSLMRIIEYAQWAMLISYAHLFHLWPYAERQPNSSDKPRKMFQTSPKNIMFRCHQELLLCELPSKKFLLRTSKQKLLCAKSSSAENRPEPAELSAKKNLELRLRSHKRSLRLMSSGDLFGAISWGWSLDVRLSTGRLMRRKTNNFQNFRIIQETSFISRRPPDSQAVASSRRRSQRTMTVNDKTRAMHLIACCGSHRRLFSEAV